MFGDNTCPNPQDAIYDWVSKCPENKERVGGLPVKRFFVSEDPDVIKNYISERKASMKKVVYSSAITGKLFNSKAAVMDDFKKNHVKPLTLLEVQNQNRFQIEEHFLGFIQKHLTEDKIAGFVEALVQHPEFGPYLEKWVNRTRNLSPFSRMRRPSPWGLGLPRVARESGIAAFGGSRRWEDHLCAGAGSGAWPL